MLANSKQLPQAVRTAQAPPSAKAMPAAFSIRSAPLPNFGHCACGGGCPRCQTGLLASSANHVVGRPGDAAERAADRIAGRVMGMSRTSGAQHVAAADVTVRAGGPVSGFASGESGGPPARETPASVDSGGSPLPPSVRGFFEPRFGRDFSDVRVHDDEVAAQESDGLGARAFTFRNHISLARGESVAATPLLAHELAHVVQGHDGAPDVIRRKETWDFTPANFAALKKSKGDLKIAGDSSWVPAKLQENLLKTLRYVLDAKRSPSATEGINPTDFYHGHLIVPDNKTGLTADAMDARSAYKKEWDNQTAATLGGAYGRVTDKNVGAYTKGIKSVLPLLGQAMEEVMKIKGAAVMYHTFELSDPSDLADKTKRVDPNDPRRNFLTPFDTNTPQPFKLPKGGKNYLDKYVHYLEFTFLADQSGEVHVRPGGRDPLSTITGAPIPGQ